jgi:glycosyltransferase involved in cell wall biosynthesis
MAPTAVRTASRVLVAIPAYNEAPTIEEVVRRVRTAVPMFDLLVVNDGSRDETGAALARCGVMTATHLCNLGYGRALQTAIMYAQRHGYDALITFDADGQHDARDLERLYGAFSLGGYDLLIGSRFIGGQKYGAEPFVRSVGMRVFSRLIALLTAERVYDTSSGMKVIGSRVFGVLAAGQFVDFHAEAIMYLLRLGYRVGESPITVAPRQHGESMYTSLSAVKYPLKVFFLMLLTMLEARRRGGQRSRP